MGSKSISNELLLEWQILSKILRSLWVIDKSTHYLICSRHKSIEKHILSYVTADKDLYKSSKAVLDRTEYMRRDYLSDIVDSFIIGNSKYINILRLRGLTRSEINHCCLLTLGLNSKEAGSITQNRNHYNNSSNIRAKFGLSSNETNLSIYLKTLYEKCQYETFDSSVSE
mgnify:FL=1